MVQKVIKIGSSIGVTIPKDAAHESGFRAGDSVRIVKAAGGKIEFEKVSAGKVANNEVVEWANEFVSKHLDAFKELADK